MSNSLQNSILLIPSVLCCYALKFGAFGHVNRFKQSLMVVKRRTYNSKWHLNTIENWIGYRKQYDISGPITE